MIPETVSLSNSVPKKKDDNCFFFEDTQHFSFLLEKLNILRKNRQFCDVILQVGSPQDVHEIHAHRAVLASASTYFLDIFTNDLRSTPSGIPQIQLYKLLSGNYDAEAFEYLIDYIYSSRLEIPKDKVKAVYALANRLKMTSIAHQCGQFLASALTPESCLAVRAIHGVLSDPILLSAVDNYIRTNISKVSECKYLENLPKIQIEILQNSNEERDATNEKHMFNMVLEWIRKAFDIDKMDLAALTGKVFLLYLNKSDKKLHDCNDIDNDDSNYSDVIQDYKMLSRKMSLPKKCDKEEVNCNIILQKTPAKPRQFLFTRSDSDSSLSSIADDDENDWKVLATHSPSKHTAIGLLMIAGKLCMLSVKLKLNTRNNTSNGSRGESAEKCDLFTLIAPMSSARCALGVACFKDKLLVCGGYDRGECLKSVEIYDSLSNKWSTLAPMNVSRGRFDVAVIGDSVYAVGGSDGQKELNSGEHLDPISMLWKTIPNCPVVRSNAG